jgi:hypothetical protein
MSSKSTTIVPSYTLPVSNSIVAQARVMDCSLISTAFGTYNPVSLQRLDGRQLSLSEILQIAIDICEDDSSVATQAREE